MSAYYSTQASIEAKVKASRVRLWGDKNEDGLIDSTTLTQALAFAKNHINAFLYQRYGSQIESWDSTTVPDLLKPISDDLALFYLASGANVVNPVIQQNYDLAMQTLMSLRDYRMDLPSTVSDLDEESLTETLDSDYDEDTDGSGYADLSAYRLR